MKYFINVNQLILSEHENLDIKDAAILDYIYFYCNSQNVKIVKNRVCENNFCWTWINYNALLKDMPLLRLKSVGSLTPRIDRLKKAGYIRTKRLGNQKLYFRTTQKIDELFIKMNRAVQENEQSCSFKRTNKDKRDKDKKINTTSDASVAGKSELIKSIKDIPEIIHLFEQVNPSCKRYYNNTSQRAACQRLLDLYGFEQIARVIKILPKTNEMKYAPTITTPCQLEDKYKALEAFCKKEFRKAKQKFEDEQIFNQLTSIRHNQ